MFTLMRCANGVGGFYWALLRTEKAETETVGQLLNEEIAHRVRDLLNRHGERDEAWRRCGHSDCFMQMQCARQPCTATEEGIEEPQHHD